MDPKDPPNGPGRELAPIPLRPRALSIASNQDQRLNFNALQTGLSNVGLGLKGIHIKGNHARFQIINARFRSSTQGLGRAVRTISQFLSKDIESLSIEFMKKDMVVFSAHIERADLERYALSANPSQEMLDKIDFSDRSERLPLQIRENIFSWSLGPYVEYSLFDPQAPLRGDVGAKVLGQWALGSGLYINGEVRKSIFGDFGRVLRTSNSVLPHVRSDHAIYGRDGDPSLDRFTLTKFGKLTPRVYSRVCAGYLEKMYAGAVSYTHLTLPTN